MLFLIVPSLSLWDGPSHPSARVIGSELPPPRIPSWRFGAGLISGMAGILIRRLNVGFEIPQGTSFRSAF